MAIVTIFDLQKKEKDNGKTWKMIMENVTMIYSFSHGTWYHMDNFSMVKHGDRVTIS